MRTSIPVTLLFFIAVFFQASGQVLTNVSVPSGACIGDAAVASFTASGFPVNAIFDVQISNPQGIFVANATVVGSGRVSPVPLYFPAGIQPGQLVKLRIVNRVNQVSYFQANCPVTNCGNKVVSTKAFSTESTAAVCLGTSIQIPFTHLNITAQETFAVWYKKEGNPSYFSIAATINNQRNQASVFIPLSFGPATGVQFMVGALNANGSVLAYGSFSPTKANIASCFTLNDLQPVCKATPELMAADSLLKGSRTGIPTNAVFKAVLSNPFGAFPLNPVASFSSNTFPVAVKYPCSLANGTGYKWHVTASQNGVVVAETYSKPFTIQTCPASLLVSTTTLKVKSRSVAPGGSNAAYDSICLGSADSRIVLSTTGCFNLNNTFSLVLRSENPTRPAITVPVAGINGPVVFPKSIPTGYYSLQLVSTSPVLQSAETQLVRLVNCRQLTLNSLCKTGTTVYASFTSEGDIPTGTQYRLTGEALGLPINGPFNTGSPLTMPNMLPGMAVKFSVTSSITGFKSSNFLTASLEQMQTCPTSSITLQAPASASFCKGGMFTLAFTKTGFVDTMSRFQAVLTSAEGTQYVMNAKHGKTTSPLTFDIGNVGNSAAFSLKLTCTNPTVTSNTISGLVLGNCPTITMGAFASNQVLCSGTQFSVLFTTSGAFNAGNQFRVELSDGSGNFQSPVVIGSGAASPLTAVLPHSLAAGGQYRLRVVSTAPYIKPAAFSARFEVLASPTIYNTALSSAGAKHIVVGTGFTNTMQVLYQTTAATYSFTNSNYILSNIPVGVPAGQMKVKVGGCFSNGMAYTLPPLARIAVSEEAVSETEVLYTVESKATVFPNPARETATFRWNHGSKTHYRLINLMGSEVQSGNMEAEQTDLLLDLSRQPKGIYLLLYMDGKDRKEIKLIKE